MKQIMSEIVVKTFNYSELSSVNLIDEFEAADVVGLSVSNSQAKLLRCAWQKYDSHKISCYKGSVFKCVISKSLWLLCDKYISALFRDLAGVNKLYYSIGKKAFPVQFVKKNDGYSVWFCKKQEDDERRYEVTRYVAERGAVQAQCSLATLYASGQGVNQDYKEASKWFLVSAESGDLDAQYGLAYLYIKGDGVEKNDGKALYWLRKAANNGHAVSKELLQKMDISLDG